jgi:hypothetical protein
VYSKGDILIDKEQESQVVVVQLSTERCENVVVKSKDVGENRYADQTVYDYNSRYDYVQPDDPVVRAVYAESLPAKPDELTQKGRRLLVQNTDVQAYSFPISRLMPADERSGRS